VAKHRRQVTDSVGHGRHLAGCASHIEYIMNEWMNSFDLKLPTCGDTMYCCYGFASRPIGCSQLTYISHRRRAMPHHDCIGMRTITRNGLKYLREVITTLSWCDKAYTATDCPGLDYAYQQLLLSHPASG